MEQFDLAEYLENPSRKVVTRDGRNVTIHCTNYQGFFPVVAEIEGLNTSMAFSISGVYGHVQGSVYDLFFAPEKHEGWVNIYKDAYNNYVGQYRIFESKEVAEKEGKGCKAYIATVKIEWEE